MGLYFIRGTFTLANKYTAGTVFPVLNIPARIAERAPIQLFNANNNYSVNAVAVANKISIVNANDVNAPVVMSICAIISA